MIQTKVLVVDDSVTVRQQVGLALGQAGFAVIEAADGVQGLAALRGDKRISMVILDVHMPNMNGLEMLEAMAKDSGRKPSVLVLSTEGHPELLQRAKRAGAKGWIVKPFNAKHLVSAVKKLTGTA